MYLDVFAKRLKVLRLSHGLSLQNVGDSVGSTRHSIGNLENLHASPSLAMVLALADLFDVSVDYLVGRADDPARGGSGDGGQDELDAAQELEKKKLMGMIDALREDDAGKAISYVAFLRHLRRREDWKKRRAESKRDKKVD